jgi:NAD(P)-dependent dehydrogenase (short-subunit alcohol dehydrogenase family)
MVSEVRIAPEAGREGLLLMKGKRAVVTGGSRGIGFEIARLLMAHGANVLAVSRSSAHLEEAGRALPSLEILQADVAVPQDVDRLARWVETHWGRLDVLVNNAGVFLDDDTDLVAQPDEAFEATMRVNLFGPYLCTKRLAPLLLKSDDPRVVNIGSSMGVLSPGLSGVYSVSKAGLNALTIAFANALRGQVAVNCLSPGWVRTDMAPDAPGDPKRSAEDLLWLLSQRRSVSGGFFEGRKQIPWAHR